MTSKITWAEKEYLTITLLYYLILQVPPLNNLTVAVSVKIIMILVKISVLLSTLILRGIPSDKARLLKWATVTFVAVVQRKISGWEDRYVEIVVGISARLETGQITSPIEWFAERKDVKGS